MSNAPRPEADGSQVALAAAPGGLNVCFSKWLDVCGVAAATACLAHCLLLPLVFALLPALSSVLAVPEEAHIVALAVAVPISGWAMLRGYATHGVLQPVVMACAGLLALGCGAFGGFELLLETGFTVVGSLALSAAHLQNWRFNTAALRPSEVGGGLG